jgi:hypothetical protein
MKAYFSSALVALALILPAQSRADYIPPGYEWVGMLDASIGGSTYRLFSAANADDEISDLYYTNDYNQNRDTTDKIYTVQASVMPDRQAEHINPTVLIEFKRMRGSSRMKPLRVFLIDATWDLPMAADPGSGFGEIAVTNMHFNPADGRIRFNISATLARIDMDSYAEVPRVGAVRITGNYAGTFPAFALQYPRIFGDY